MKKIVVLIILICFCSFPVRAEENYITQYKNVGADELEKSLDEQTREFFEQNGIDASDYNWVNKLTVGNVFGHILNFLATGAENPFKTGILMASIIFLSAALTAFGTSARFETAIYAAVLAISALIASDILQTVSAAVNAIKGVSSFMLSFVPVFASILALSGKTVTASAMSALLLGAAEAVAFVSSFAVVPLMSGYLALGVSSGVSPLLNGSGIAESVKKVSMWILSFLCTLFIGILSVQTAVNSAADSVTLRTAKFILGTSVPVVGGALGEAVSTISASMGLLRSSVGIYGVVALCFMLLPIVAELVLWRCALMVNIALGELFSLSKVSSVLRAVEFVLSVLLGVVSVVGGMFIISLTVIITAGKS